MVDIQAKVQDVNGILTAIFSRLAVQTRRESNTSLKELKRKRSIMGKIYNFCKSLHTPVRDTKETRVASFMTWG